MKFGACCLPLLACAHPTLSDFSHKILHCAAAQQLSRSPRTRVGAKQAAARCPDARHCPRRLLSVLDIFSEGSKRKLRESGRTGSLPFDKAQERNPKYTALARRPGPPYLPKWVSFATHHKITPSSHPRSTGELARRPRPGQQTNPLPPWSAPGRWPRASVNPACPAGTHAQQSDQICPAIRNGDKSTRGNLRPETPEARPGGLWKLKAFTVSHALFSRRRSTRDPT